MSLTIVSNHPLFPFLEFPEGTSVTFDDGDENATTMMYLRTNNYNSIKHVKFDDEVMSLETAALRLISRNCRMINVNTLSAVELGDTAVTEDYIFMSIESTGKVAVYELPIGCKLHNLPEDLKSLILNHLTGQNITGLYEGLKAFMNPLRTVTLDFTKGLFRECTVKYHDKGFVSTLELTTSKGTEERLIPSSVNPLSVVVKDDEHPDMKINGEPIVWIDVVTMDEIVPDEGKGERIDKYGFLRQLTVGTTPPPQTDTMTWDVYTFHKRDDIVVVRKPGLSKKTVRIQVNPDFCLATDLVKRDLVYLNLLF